MAQPVRARRLTDEEGRRLQQIVRRGKHGPIRVRRAMMIMASASGTLVPAIARLVAADQDTVRDVIHAFNQKGLAALDPRWAGGRPRLISDEATGVIVAAATTRPEKLGPPFTRWSLRKLAAYLADCPRPARIGRERLRQIQRTSRSRLTCWASLRAGACFLGRTRGRRGGSSPWTPCGIRPAIHPVAGRRETTRLELVDVTVYQQKQQKQARCGPSGGSLPPVARTDLRR
jgi:transposase